jgi:hypothetical protein
MHVEDVGSSMQTILEVQLWKVDPLKVDVDEAGARLDVPDVLLLAACHVVPPKRD